MVTFRSIDVQSPHSQAIIQDKYYQMLTLSQRYERASRWFTSRRTLRRALPRQSDIGQIAVFEARPKAQPTLTIPTFWVTTEGIKEFVALIDTGCNTSIIHSDLLLTLLDEGGNRFVITRLEVPLSLLSASGGVVKVNRSANLTFQVDGVQIKHSFYLMDTVPMPQKVLLGMDFIVEHGVCIDAPNDTISIMSPKYSTPSDTFALTSKEDITLQALQTCCVSLSSPNGLRPAQPLGYVYPDNALPDGCILWHGVHQLQDTTQVWLTNATDRDITISNSTPIAWAEPDTSGEISRADRLHGAAMGNPSTSSLGILAFSTATNGDDWEWGGEHLYLDLSNTPVGQPDPPVDASITQLNEAWHEGIRDLSQVHDLDNARVAIQRLSRITTRIKHYQEEDASPVHELPSDLDLVNGYDHLSTGQKQLLKEALCSEAAFFMKGKYPKVIRTDQPVHIDVGKARPRTSGFRRLNPEEQALVNEYVEKLMAADVVEACNGPWSSPILLVPKKDGGLRAVADLRRVNECVVADSYAMPDTQELLDQLSEATWFSSIDLSSAFWQLPLEEESRDCTAFMTKTHGLLRWKALPMGFKNSSAYFQREIDSALKGLRLTCCVVYIDDVCVYSKGSLEDHLDKVRAVLRALRVVGFSGNPAKCKFAQR